MKIKGGNSEKKNTCMYYNEPKRSRNGSGGIMIKRDYETLESLKTSALEGKTR